MALATGLVGDGKVINREKTPPVPFIVNIGPFESIWTVEIETERREWYALTLAAANAAVTANLQPADYDPPIDSDATYSWSMDISENVVNAYTVIRTSELKIYTPGA